MSLRFCLGADSMTGSEQVLIWIWIIGIIHVNTSSTAAGTIYISLTLASNSCTNASSFCRADITFSLTGEVNMWKTSKVLENMTSVEK